MEVQLLGLVLLLVPDMPLEPVLLEPMPEVDEPVRSWVLEDDVEERVESWLPLDDDWVALGEVWLDDELVDWP